MFRFAAKTKQAEVKPAAQPAAPARGGLPNQARLRRLGAADDPFEREARLAAETVLPGLPSLGGLPSNGEALDPALRAAFEQRFGADFSAVRIHTNTAAAAQLQARAFTDGRDIVFGDRQFAPDTVAGQRRLAHELAHVVQQSGGATKVGLSADHSGTVRRDPDPQTAEAERAAVEIWGIINGIDALGAEVEVTYYVSNGAMTLTGFSQTKPGSGSAGATDFDRFKAGALGFKGGSAAGSTLVTFAGTAARYFKITFRRENTGWALQAWGDVPGTAPPPEGRANPNAAAAGWPADVYTRAQTEVAKWLPVLKTYPQGTAELKLRAEMEDSRLTKLDLVSQTNAGGKGPAFAPAAPDTETILVNAILGFAQGLGPRKINLTLNGAAPDGQTHWRVMEAGTDRGPADPVPDEAAAIVADYRHMHAEIIRKWRENVKDAGIMVAGFGAEQLALWLLGGMVFRGLGLLFEAAAPRLLNFVRLGAAGGSRAGFEYLETMVARLPIAERTEMQGLMTRMETEGLEALNATEKKSFNSLLQKLESLIEAPMTTAEKDVLRSRMATRFNAAKPGVEAAFQSAGRGAQIHHRLPLEWAHRFPGFDVNAGKNLIGLDETVHRGVNAVWTRLRTSAAASKVDGNVVTKVIDIVDRNFGKWYDKVPGSAGAALESEVAAAKEAARAEVDALVSKL